MKWYLWVFSLMLVSALIFIPQTLRTVNAIPANVVISQTTNIGNQSWSTIGTSPQIISTNGNPVYFQFFNNTSSYTIPTGYGTYVFNVPNCGMQFYPPVLSTIGQTPIIGSMSHILTQGFSSVGPFKPTNLFNHTCTNVVSNTGTDLIINGTISNANATVHLVYTLTNGQPMKTTYKIIPKISGWFWKFTETEFNIPHTILTGNATFIENYTTPSNNTVSFIQKDIVGTPRVYFSDSHGNLITYDYQTSLSTLTDTGIFYNSTSSATVLFNDFTTTSSLSANQTYSIDPLVYGNNFATNYQIITSQVTGVSCGTPQTRQQLFNDITIPLSSSTSSCTRMAYEFPIGGLNGTIIDDVQIQFVTTGAINSRSCNINNIADRPSISSPSTIWNDISTGTSFVSGSLSCASNSTTTNSIDLGQNGINTLQSRVTNAISNNWWAVGIMSNSETRDSVLHTVTLPNSVRLLVVYHHATPSAPLNMLSVGHPAKNTITYSLPATNGSSNITNFNLLRATFPFAQTPLPDNKNTDPESYSSRINDVNNTELYHFEVNKILNFYNDSSESFQPAFGGGETSFRNSIIITNDTFTYPTSTLAQAQWPDNNAHQFFYNDWTNHNIKMKMVVQNPMPGSSFTSLDLLNKTGFNASNTNWTLRAKVTLTDYIQYTFGFPPNIYIGLSNVNGSSIISSNQNFLGFTLQMGGGPACHVWEIIQLQNNNAGSGTSCAPLGFTTLSHGLNVETLYVQLTRNNSTSYTGTLYSDPNYSAVVATASASIPNTIKDLRWIYVEGIIQATGSDGRLQGTVDDMEFWNGDYTKVPVVQFNNGILNNSLNFTNTSFMSYGIGAPPVQNTNEFTIVTELKKGLGNFNILNFTNTLSNGITFGQNDTYLYIKNGSSYILQDPNIIHKNSLNQIGFNRNVNNWCGIDNGSYIGCITKSGSIGQSNIGSGNGRYTTGFGVGLLDEFAIYTSGENPTFFNNMNQRFSNSLKITKEVGPVFSIDDRGLGSGQNFFYRTQAINIFGNGTLSKVVNSTTSVLPTAPRNPILNIINFNTIKIQCTAPLSNGGDPIQSYQIKRNGTIITNSTTALCSGYFDSPINVGDNQTYSIAAWNGVGLGPFVSISSNSVITTKGNVTLDQYTVGDTIAINATIHILSGQPSPIIVKNVALFVNNTLWQNATVNQNVQTGDTFDYATFWYQFKSSTNQTFSLQVKVTNSTGTPFQKNIQLKSTNSSLHWAYPPTYSPAKVVTLGTVNYTLSRPGDETHVYLKANRDLNGSTWQVECLYQTPSQISVTPTGTQHGTWINRTNVGYINQTYLDPTSHFNIYITCYDPNQILFTTTSYSNSSLLVAGISYFDSTFQGFIGVPTGVFFIALVAGLATGRTAPTFVVIVLGVVAVMAAIGFFVISQPVWGLCLVAASLCLFGGKRFL